MATVGNHNKAKGSLNERKAKTLLEADGFHVMKAGGSFGPADLIALKCGQILLVQVKSEEQLAPAKWNELLDLARSIDGPRTHCEAIHCAVLFRKIVWHRIHGPKTAARTVHPPWEIWHADEVDP